jgi:hypothetical protein
MVIISVIWIQIGKDPKLWPDPDPDQISDHELGQRKIIKEVKKERAILLIKCIFLKRLKYSLNPPLFIFLIKVVSGRLALQH